MADPVYPMQEVIICYDPAASAGAPIITMERDQRNAWWHVIGAKPVRPAVGLEELLVLSDSSWRQFVLREFNV
jgi:hypothetical protein